MNGKRSLFVATMAVGVGFALGLPVWPAEPQDSVVNTPHNLSATGPGPIRAPSESEVCLFCHISHRAGVTPLWNRSLSEVAYLSYKSATAKAMPGQPSGTSKLCLSCHDGTIAVGRFLSQKESVAVGGGGRPRGRKNLGTDLTDDHPVSVSYRQAQAGNPKRYRASPKATGHQLLDEMGQVQCTSCHDPHRNQHGKFLVMDNREGRLCISCHELEEWALSSHNTSTKRWNGAGHDPWPHTEYETVRGNGCANCHSVHDAGGAEHLLYFDLEADTCYSCHNGAVASKDVRADFEKPFRHRVEAAVGRRGKTIGREFDTSRVGCSDCHNPHASNDSEIAKPNVSGAMRYVSGVSAAGSVLERAQFEQEVCYKCHSLTGQRDVARPLRRWRMQSSLRERFHPTAVSFHPIEAVGRNPDVPSLLPPLSENSMISCMDCHSSDSGSEGGAGVRGPHGSDYRYLLSARYETGDNVTESEHAYALCYKCHDRMNILSDRSFPGHNSHITTYRTPCSVCHDPHGISRSEGTTIGNAHLINFDLTVVRPDTITGRVDYLAEGPGSATCFLNCHGIDHSPLNY